MSLLESHLLFEASVLGLTVSKQRYVYPLELGSSPYAFLLLALFNPRSLPNTFVRSRQLTHSIFKIKNDNYDFY